jgi:hypothetical protein
MSRPIVTCRICGKLVPVEDAKTDGNGKAVHEVCIATELGKIRSKTVPPRPDRG